MSNKFKPYKKSFYKDNYDYKFDLKGETNSALRNNFRKNKQKFLKGETEVEFNDIFTVPSQWFY